LVIDALAPEKCALVEKGPSRLNAPVADILRPQLKQESEIERDEPMFTRSFMDIKEAKTAGLLTLTSPNRSTVEYSCAILSNPVGPVVESE
jgi:hypothetical protein